MKKTFLIIVAVLTMTALLTGCSMTVTKTKTEVESIKGSAFESSAEEPSSVSFAKTIDFSITNATGFMVTSMVVKASDNDKIVDLVKKNDPFMNWEVRSFSYELPDENISSVHPNQGEAKDGAKEPEALGAEQPATAAEQAGAGQQAANGQANTEQVTEVTTKAAGTEQAGQLTEVTTEPETLLFTENDLLPAAKVLPTEYTIDVTLDNGATFTLHAFPMEDAVRMILAYEDGVGYLVYESLINDKMVNTYATEQMLALTGGYAGYNYTDPTYGYNYGYDYSYDYNYNYDYSYQEPVTQAQSSGQEGCLDGGLFW